MGVDILDRKKKHILASNIMLGDSQSQNMLPIMVPHIIFLYFSYTYSDHYFSWFPCPGPLQCMISVGQETLMYSLYEIKTREHFTKTFSIEN